MTNPNLAVLEPNGHELLKAVAGGMPLHEALNAALSKSISWPYSIGSVVVKDYEGTHVLSLNSVIHTSPGATQVNAESAACALISVNELAGQGLREAYAKTAEFKSLKRRVLPQTEYPRNDNPIAIVVAVEHGGSIESLAEEIQRINFGISSNLWPDMVVILSKGAINYAVQPEGDRILGDFILPNDSGFQPMPMYVHVMGRSLGSTTYIRLCQFVFLQLQIFSPGAKVPDLSKDMPQEYSIGMTLGAYQFDLSGKLIKVPNEMYSERGAGLRNLPFRIEEQNGNLLSHIQFIPWQDGGVIRMYGKIPVEAMLVFFGKEALRGQKYKTKDGEMTSVLRLSKKQFLEGLNRFQLRSNMRIRPEEPKWVVTKMGDEGTSSPFIARLLLTPIHFRDSAVTDESEKKAFDQAYDSILTTLLNVRDTADSIRSLIADHKESIGRGELVRLVGKQIHVDKSLDKELRKEFHEFVMSAARTMKQGVQDLTKVLGIDIGFLFSKTNTFNKGLERTIQSHVDLAQYLKEVRNWSEPLMELRNKIDHQGWLLPRVNYNNKDGKVDVIVPQIDTESVDAYVERVLDRLLCFVEDISIYALQHKVGPTLSVTEIPIAERPKDRPERFRFALAQGGERLWNIRHDGRRFSER